MKWLPTRLVKKYLIPGRMSLRDNDYKYATVPHCVKCVPRVKYGNNYIALTRGGEVNIDNLCGGKKESIKYLSSKSRKNMLMKIDEISNVFKPNYLLTLTYPKEFPHEGGKIKKDLGSLYSYIRGDKYNKEKDSSIIMFWKLEFQQRGAPHYHILVQSALDKQTLLAHLLRKWMMVTNNDNPVCVDLDPIRHKFQTEIYMSLHFSKDSQNHKPDDFDRPGRFWGLLGYDRVRVLSRQWKDKQGAEKTYRQPVFIRPACPVVAAAVLPPLSSVVAAVLPPLYQVDRNDHYEQLTV